MNLEERLKQKIRESGAERIDRDGIFKTLLPFILDECTEVRRSLLNDMLKYEREKMMRAQARGTLFHAGVMQAIQIKAVELDLELSST